MKTNWKQVGSMAVCAVVCAASQPARADIIYSGPISLGGDAYYATFTYDGSGANTTSWTVPVGVSSVQVLVVGGGGAGGAWYGGGGGAGGVVYAGSETVANILASQFYGSSYAVTPGDNPTVIVGAGAPQNKAAARGGTGGNSQFDTLIAYGGQGGKSNNSSPYGQGGQAGYAGGTPYQGYAGGATDYSSGGGAGGAGNANGAGPGGMGLQIGITGTPTYYGGGGGSLGSTNLGGLGGGGNGSATDGGPSTAGTADTGGGGGACWGVNNPAGGGAGGSGIVIVAYTIPEPASGLLLFAGAVGLGLIRRKLRG